MPLTEHLRELRSRLVKSGIAVVVGMVVGWIAYPTIFDLLSQPFEGAVEQAQKEGRDVTLALTGGLTLSSCNSRSRRLRELFWPRPCGYISCGDS